MSRLLFLSIMLTAMCTTAFAQFVSVKDQQFQLNNKPYKFVGTNYWYGSLLGLEKNKKRGIERLRKELDFLKRNGVTNLRLMAGAEGSGMINGVTRVGPPLQTEQEKFDANALDGLDLVLAEMSKRKMKAVIFLSNNWEWSGGFQQYLIWNQIVPPDMRTRQLTWDELRDIVARFYVCYECKAAYRAQMRFVLDRTNTITRRKYIDDPTIMAWELANEPRPMRPGARERYVEWIRDVAADIKSRDKRHLVTIGHEGRIGTESMELFEEVHRDPNIDYLTIHVWAKNWGWYKTGNLANGFPVALAAATGYIEDHMTVAERLNKPLVIEEFGLPRDEQNGALSFEPGSSTHFRDEYFKKIFSYVGQGPVAGANFWAFGGTARPVKGQTFWKSGDEWMGDPPMEEQGLNSVFDNDVSTWGVIRAASRRP